MNTISASQLEAFAARLLEAGGLAEDEARRVAASLVAADLRGHASHGVMRIPYYLDAVRKGDIRPGVDLGILRETECLLVADGHWGLGQTQAHRLLDALVPKARRQGIALGTLMHSGHIGRLGEYCEKAAELGLVSMVMVNTHGTARRVAPVGGTAPRLGTNPLAIGAPAGAEPLVLDFGTSAVAEGKVRLLKIADRRCPEGWLLDAGGQPTTDPHSLYGDPPGTIRPMGGEQAYKGFGLALMIEVLTGALSGGVCARETPVNPVGNCVYMQLIDPEAVGGTEHFAAEVGGLVEFVRDCPRVPGVDAITLPGDPERRAHRRRTAEGIAIDEGNWRALTDLAARLNVALPS